ncbi:sigma-54 interaction domain-containing protein [Desulfofustis limnaeus]|jgi:PAS domain S-box-containing protein|uniref:Uncharacterized protein n=1 Tax=Desulfofustis limnaeus TaxID=2740163 RepID=A0ABN6M8Z6_9BACT|nr:sigma 54-interacting transcriptional regulator [Desulfofustis limnaeus]MDX9894268.1 sigma 54-interacting transcriptional regulator [Desulfofustis sp.]BDD88810.1 hypothetical protein DPPLL_31750 [Desulfofustis limnaeus]
MAKQDQRAAPTPAAQAGKTEFLRASPLLSGSTMANALEERVKELNCLYGISNLVETQDVTLPWILERAVELIPAALQFPERASARIRLDGKEYRSANFTTTRRRLNTAIMLHGTPVGDLDVFYKEPAAGGESGLFLEEESHLLHAIGERLSRVLWIKVSEEALRESEERYRILVEKVTDGVSLVQDNRIHYVNPAFCRMFGIDTPEQVIDTPVGDPGTGNVSAISDLYHHLEAGISERHEELKQPTRHGAITWIRASHTPIMFKGRPALLSTFNDVTEIKEQQVVAQHLAAQLHDENRLLRSSLKDRYRLGNIIGRSPLMQEVFELILKAAACDASVAIFGESGSGKELVARAIHDHSQRKGKHFVAVNCAAVQETLFEREFFGTLKGAYSGAHADAAGYLHDADHGTLFLDEVGELSLAMQAKLLRAIEGGGYRPIGGTVTSYPDLRIVSAANVPLGEKVSRGLMRNDFFYRLQVIQIRLPPLRQRKQDIPLLVDHFVETIASPAFKIPGQVMDSLLEYDWPGNVRELRNVVQRYITLGRLEFISPASDCGPALEVVPTLNLEHAVKQVEASLVAQALQRSGGNRTKAAALLGISRRALSRRISG